MWAVFEAILLKHYILLRKELFCRFIALLFLQRLRKYCIELRITILNKVVVRQFLFKIPEQVKLKQLKPRFAFKIWVLLALIVKYSLEVENRIVILQCWRPVRHQDFRVLMVLVSMLGYCNLLHEDVVDGIKLIIWVVNLEFLYEKAICFHGTNISSCHLNWIGGDSSHQWSSHWNIF